MHALTRAKLSYITKKLWSRWEKSFFSYSSVISLGFFVIYLVGFHYFSSGILCKKYICPAYRAALFSQPWPKSWKSKMKITLSNNLWIHMPEAFYLWDRAVTGILSWEVFPWHMAIINNKMVIVRLFRLSGPLLYRAFMCTRKKKAPF